MQQAVRNGSGELSMEDASHPQHHHEPGHGSRSEPAAVVPQGTIYTCPMHPQIRLPAPGNCPICGMTLEPVMPSLEEEENPALSFSGPAGRSLPGVRSR
jgi:hypothetical protein